MISDFPQGYPRVPLGLGAGVWTGGSPMHQLARSRTQHVIRRAGATPRSLSAGHPAFVGRVAGMQLLTLRPQARVQLQLQQDPPQGDLQHPRPQGWQFWARLSSTTP